MLKQLNIDFSEESWFDFWHTHVDWDGEGNQSLDIRKVYLEQLFDCFEQLRLAAKGSLAEYQVWCIMCEDSGEDAVYLHTPNPNADNYPYNFDDVVWQKDIPELISEFFDQQTMRFGKWKSPDGDFVFYIAPK